MAGRKQHRAKDDRGGHIRLYWQLFDSPAWRALSHAEHGVWLRMRRRLGATNNGDIEATLADMRHAGISSSSTLAKALRALETLGFVAKTRQGLMAAGGKVCSLYRFTDEPTLDIGKIGLKRGPASNEWKAFASLAHAEAVLREAHDNAKRPAAKNEGKLRKSKRTDSKIEAEKPRTDSKIEGSEAAALRKSKRRKLPPKPPEAAPALGPQGVKGVSQRKDPSASKIEHLYKLPSVGVDRKRGAPRSPYKVVAGIEMARITCSVATCPDNRCNAVFGEPHANGCPNEPCPKCTRQWLTCSCEGVKRWLPKQLRRKAVPA